MDLSRRSTLASVAATVTAAAGCVGRASQGTDPEDTTTDDSTTGDTTTEDDGGPPSLTGYAVSDAAVPPVTRPDAGTEPWGLFLASREAVEAQFGEITRDSVAAFLDATAFDAGDRLVYLQAYGSQTCYELALTGDPEVSAGTPTLSTAVRRTAGENAVCGAAITPVTLLVRLSFDPDRRMPAVVTARVADGGETTLTLQARR